VSADPGRPIRSTRVDVALDRGVFMISVAAELAEMHPQTLRMYEARGLIEPSRSPKGTRLYSQDDVERLRRIQQMTAQLGLNLAGVERVLALEAELDEAHAQLAELEHRAEQARAEMAAELDRVRRSFSADIVPYSGVSTALVRSADAQPTFRRRER
jgi:MerR family transcriptional regulator/heat shock protein HspR